jgi:hypothetical protein
VSLQANPSAIPLPMVSSTEVNRLATKSCDLARSAHGQHGPQAAGKAALGARSNQAPGGKEQSRPGSFEFVLAELKSAPNSRFEVFWRSLNES